MKTTKSWAYWVVCILSFIIVSGAVVIQKRSDLLPWIGDCNPNGYADGDYFMAYCHSGKYGDYEHYAYWNEVGDISMDPVRDADVLFLGNSRTQYSFSTQAVSSWFTDAKRSHYVFGFGIGSLHVVPQAFFKKFNVKPKVVVINADPFFYDFWSETNKEMRQDDVKTRWRYAVKGKMQAWQQAYCTEDSDGWFSNKLCSGRGETLYREAKTGHWLVDHYRPDKQIPVTYTTAFIKHLDDGASIAEQFVKAIGVPKECIILTATPRTKTPALYAQELSKKVGFKWVFPVVKDLKTIDDSHLNPDSAERWSAAFMAKAGPVIEACTER